MIPTVYGIISMHTHFAVFERLHLGVEHRASGFHTRFRLSLGSWKSEQVLTFRAGPSEELPWFEEVTIDGVLQSPGCRPRWSSSSNYNVGHLVNLRTKQINYNLDWSRKSSSSEEWDRPRRSGAIMVSIGLTKQISDSQWFSNWSSGVYCLSDCVMYIVYVQFNDEA